LLKTIGCGDVKSQHAGQAVTLAGWVHRRRDHGGLIFIDLRDSRGLVQVVFNPQGSPTAHKVAQEFRSEWVVRVEGEVALRPPGTQNPNLATGEVEVYATAAEVLKRRRNACSIWTSSYRLMSGRTSKILLQERFQTGAGALLAAEVKEMISKGISEALRRTNFRAMRRGTWTKFCGNSLRASAFSSRSSAR